MDVREVSNLSLTRVRSRRRMLAAAPLVLLAAAGASASASAAAVGGAAPAGTPAVTELRCPAGGGAATCPRGEVLRLSGEHLRETRTVVFLGGKGGRDDRRATPTTASPRRVLVRVPRGAKSGPVRVVTRRAGSSRPGPKLQVLPAQKVTPAASGATDGVFPVRGKYDLGTHVNTFGGGRGHQGQDILAKCGLPIVSARSGEIQHTAYQGAAGNYVVVQADDGTSQAYMHMQQPTTWEKGDAIRAGEQLGTVGSTGRSTACHLHFEHWTAPGWYLGGEPIDPLPMLKQWASQANDA